MKKSIIFLLILSVLLTSGCYTLRKKFVRKKKYEKEEPAYVAFKEYPTKPSRQAYIDYYIFIKGWLDELSSELSDSFNITKAYSAKRAKRAINEALMNLEQIISFFNEEGRQKISPLHKDLLKIKDLVEKNPSMSNLERNSLLQKVERFRRSFEEDFKYSNAEKWMQ